MTGNDTDTTEARTEPQIEADPSAAPRRSLTRAAVAGLRGHGRLARALALMAVAAVVGVAYLVGGPPTSGAQAASDMRAPSWAAAQGPVAAASAAGASVDKAAAAGVPVAPESGTFSGSDAVPGGITQTTDQSHVLAAVESTQIVKTGQMTLEVTDIENALTQAQKTIAGLDGSVDSSSRAGTGDEATASITFRVPVGQWDAALSALHKVGTKVLFEQTGATDVTAQVVDLDARLANLRTTEAALQAIMGRAVAVADVIAVESKLSEVQGQIEELTAEINQLKDQAAMSTLTVMFQLPAQTVTTQATQDWTLGSQIDQAGAALVRIGQGLATIVVWFFVVALPLALAALMLFGILAVIRRIFRRGRRGNAAVGA